MLIVIANQLLKVLGDFLELANGIVGTASAFTDRVFKAVVDMVMHQVFLGAADRFFYGLQLLRDFQTATPFLQHSENTVKVALSPLEPLD
jgi:hypothetical protein